MVVFEGGGEPGVSVGEAAGVEKVVVEVLGEFEPWEGMERMNGAVGGM